MIKNKLTARGLLAALCVFGLAATAVQAQTATQAAPATSSAIAVGQGPEGVAPGVSALIALIAHGPAFPLAGGPDNRPRWRNAVWR